MSVTPPFDPPPLPPRPQPWPPRQPRRPSILLPLLLGALAAFLIYRYFIDRGTPALDPRPVTPRGELAADEKATIDLFRENNPSVVFITTVSRTYDIWTGSIQDIPEGTGSGFIWDDAGHIVTNFHVVASRSPARVTLWDHSTYPAALVGAAPDQDLAVLRIDAPKSKLRPVLIGSSADLQVGQKVFAIGNPFGLDQTLTTGIVSALGRSIQSLTNRPIDDMIQTDAAINPGNSGGPLLDSAGRLIGVNTAIYSPSGSSAGIGFAIPIDTVNRFVPQLVKTGRVATLTIGAAFNDRVSQIVTRQLGVKGVLIMGVQRGSPAAEAGLRSTRRTPEGVIPGDIITHVDGRAVASVAEFLAALQRYSAGDTVTLTILREGQPQKVPVRIVATGS